MAQEGQEQRGMMMNQVSKLRIWIIEGLGIRKWDVVKSVTTESNPKSKANAHMDLKPSSEHGPGFKSFYGNLPER